MLHCSAVIQTVNSTINFVLKFCRSHIHKTNFIIPNSLCLLVTYNFLRLHCFFFAASLNKSSIKFQIFLISSLRWVCINYFVCLREGAKKKLAIPTIPWCKKCQQVGYMWQENWIETHSVGGIWAERIFIDGFLPIDQISSNVSNGCQFKILLSFSSTHSPSTDHDLYLGFMIQINRGYI